MRHQRIGGLKSGACAALSQLAAVCGGRVYKSGPADVAVTAATASTAKGHTWQVLQSAQACAVSQLCRSFGTALRASWCVQLGLAANVCFISTGIRAESGPDGAVGSPNADTINIKISNKTERNMGRQTAWQLKKFKTQTINAAPRLAEGLMLAVNPMQHWLKDRQNSVAEGKAAPFQRLFAIKKRANYVRSTCAHSIFRSFFVIPAICWTL